MVHSNPDWFPLAKTTIFAGAVDLAELAARLESFNTFDRRGDTIFMDGFEGGLGSWVTDSSGAGGGVAITALAKRNGGQAARLTAGSDGSRFAVIRHFNPILVGGTFGYEISFALSAATTFVDFIIVHQTGSQIVTYTIRFTVATQVLAFLNSGGTFTTMESNLLVILDNTLFNTLKIVVDVDRQEYVRVLFNNLAFALPSAGALVGASIVDPHVRVDAFILSDIGNNPTMDCDDIILTQNEPV